ncbi:hypothetical protein F5Y14DRAFT_34031 [Nemania sp. NC0429]|nr:hypothetical protein F5Y14DRAFT_34031 [Nemania sp. NC0429]
MAEPQAANPPSPPTSFTRFSELPEKLRRTIWKMAMSRRRKFRMPDYPPGQLRGVEALTLGDEKFLGVPVFFFVNRECRDVALDMYHPTILHLDVRRPCPEEKWPLLLQGGDRVIFDEKYFGVRTEYSVSDEELALLPNHHARNIGPKIVYGTNTVIQSGLAGTVRDFCLYAEMMAKPRPAIEAKLRATINTVLRPLHKAMISAPDLDSEPESESEFESEFESELGTWTKVETELGAWTKIETGL